MVKNTAPVLDYCNPFTPAQRDAVARWIRALEVRFWIKIGSMLVAGLPLSVLAPAVIALVIVAIQQKWRAEEPFGFWPVFWLGAIVLVPLLYWLEHRTRGEFFSDTVRDAGLGDNINSTGQIRTASWGEYEMQTSAASWAMIIEVFLFAPRMTLGALRQFRMRRNLGPGDLSRAEDVIDVLRAGGEGIDPARLLLPNDSVQDLWPTLLLLVMHDVIGVSKSHDRVWLLTDARNAIRHST